MTPQTIAIDRIRCDGHGICADVVPEMIALDDWGYPIIEGRPVPAHLLHHARRAVRSCPVQALRLQAAIGVVQPDAAPGRTNAPNGASHRKV